MEKKRWDRDAPGYISPQTKMLKVVMTFGDNQTTNEIAKNSGMTVRQVHHSGEALRGRSFLVKNTERTGGFGPGLITRWKMRPQRKEHAEKLVREAFGEAS